jgi:predicted protein tyrosine phosphatase
MKVLTVCQGGNSRSVGCGFLLKYKYGIDAIACGWEGNKPETVEFLCEWADIIMIMQTEFDKHIQPRFHYKLRVVDVGPDIWCNSLHPDLLAKCDSILSTMIVTKQPNDTSEVLEKYKIEQLGETMASSKHM